MKLEKHRLKILLACTLLFVFLGFMANVLVVGWHFPQYEAAAQREKLHNIIRVISISAIFIGIALFKVSLKNKQKTLDG